jgi:hypothetical protein
MEFTVSAVCVIGNWEHVLGGSWNSMVEVLSTIAEDFELEWRLKHYDFLYSYRDQWYDLCGKGKLNVKALMALVRRKVVGCIDASSPASFEICELQA